MSPIVGTPAYEAGMMSGDTILKINDESTEGLHAARRRAPIAGQAGRNRATDRRCTKGQKDPRRADDSPGDHQRRHGARRSSAAPTARGTTFSNSDPQFGYIRITQFGEKTTDEFERALEQLNAHGT